MATRSMMAVMALALVTGASAQTTPDKRVPQEASVPVRSHYDACLLTANNSTWDALGLNSDQVTRIAEVQTRYRTYVQPPKEDPKAKQKGKKSKAVKGKETAVEAEKPVHGHLDKSAVNDAPATRGTDAVEQTLEASPDQQSAALGAQPVSFDEELRGILTPEQWAMWDKRCAETSMK